MPSVQMKAEQEKIYADQLRRAAQYAQEIEYRVGGLLTQGKFVEAVIAASELHEVSGKGITFDAYERMLSKPGLPRKVKLGGDEIIEITGRSNLYLWVGCSTDFKHIMEDAVGTKFIQMEGCNIQAYVHAMGRMDAYPFAQKSHFDAPGGPPNPVWVPVWAIPATNQMLIN